MDLNIPEVETFYDVHKRYYDKDQYNRLLDQIMEEMSELQKVLLKHRRSNHPLELNVDIKEEMSDVIISLEFIRRLFRIGNDELDITIRDKSKKIIQILVNRMEDKNGE
jgi:uncharacterized protein YabN with tetrapyrrole methylase and pyrophosphatase domain